MRIISYFVRHLAVLVFFRYSIPLRSSPRCAFETKRIEFRSRIRRRADFDRRCFLRTDCTGVTPPPGFVSELKSISLTFSEPVTGVRAGDFLINGVPAEGVSGSGASYTFSFSQPAFGPVDISWGTLHTIFDLDNPPNRFDPSTPGSTWAYQLINPAGPESYLCAAHPRHHSSSPGRGGG